MDSNNRSSAPPVMGQGLGSLGPAGSLQLSIDIISLQGPLLDHLIAAEAVYSIQLHCLCGGHLHSGPSIPLATAQRQQAVQSISEGPQFIPVASVPSTAVSMDCQFNFPLPASLRRLTESVNAAEARYEVISIFLTATSLQSTSAPSQAVGLGQSRQLLLAQASIDGIVALLYSGDVIAVELGPCLADYCYALTATATPGQGPANLLVRFTAPALAPAVDSPEFNYFTRLLAQHQNSITVAGRALLQRLKAWWEKIRLDYHHLRDRPMKFITEDESGRHRFVGNFISPIRPGRDLDGPRYAARLVSLIPFKRELSLSGGRINRWHSCAATLVRLQGDVEDHAVLLCSMLLGWNLNAFVAMGTMHSSEHRQVQHHSWVVTICSSGKVTFWEALTGEQIEFDSVEKRAKNYVSPLAASHYREVWCLFRNNEYFANVQMNCGCESTSFAINNQIHWRKFPMDTTAVQLLSHPGSPADLIYSSPNGSFVSQRDDLYELETRLERELKDWIIQHRFDVGLQTSFDDSLCVLLHPLLSSYELDRVTGVSFGNIDFQSAIRQLVRAGECFKAYPTCFNHTDSEAIKATLLKMKAFKDVAYMSSVAVIPATTAILPDPCRFGLRLRIFVYPRGMCSVWFVLAAIGFDKK